MPTVSSTVTERARPAAGDGRPQRAGESRSEVTRLRVRRTASGRLHVDTRAGLLVPRIVRVDATAAHVVLVAAGALLLAGDDLRLQIEVGPRARLELRDVAATVAYDGRGARAAWRAEVTVAPGGELTWRGEPFVVSRGADVDRALHADVAAGGRLRLRDTLVLGRHDETGGRVHARTRISHAGAPVLAEDLELRQGVTELPGILRGLRVVDQVVEVGPEPVAGTGGGGGEGPSPEPARYPEVMHTALPVPSGRGSLTRWLGTQTHASPLG